MLGADDMPIKIGEREFLLRRPLRAALRLVRQYPDLSRLLNDLAELRTSALALVISECSGQRLSAEDLMASLDPIGRGAQLRSIADRLIEHVLVLLADGNETQGKAKPGSGKRISFAEYYGDLFAQATSWPVGWSPEQAWAASPSEILAATKAGHGFVGDILKAVFGSSDDEDDTEQSGPDTSKLDRDGLAALKGLGRW